MFFVFSPKKLIYFISFHFISFSFSFHFMSFPRYIFRTIAIKCENYFFEWDRNASRFFDLDVRPFPCPQGICPAEKVEPQLLRNATPRKLVFLVLPTCFFFHLIPRKLVYISIPIYYNHKTEKNYKSEIQDIFSRIKELFGHSYGEAPRPQILLSI